MNTGRTRSALSSRRRVRFPVVVLAFLGAMLAGGIPAGNAATDALVAAVAAAPTGCLPHSMVADIADVDERCRNENWSAIYDDAPMYASWTPLDHGIQVDALQAMAVSPTGSRVFTLGANIDASANQLIEWSLVSHDTTTGEERWVQRIDADLGNLQFTQLAVSADGRRVYIGGTYKNFAERLGDGQPLVHDVAVTAAYGATTGEELWLHRFPEPTLTGDRGSDPEWLRYGEPNPEYDLHADGGLAAMVVNPTSDTVYMTGLRDGGDTYFDLAVVAYDGTSGQVKWTSYHDTSTADSPYARDVATPNLATVSSDGKRLYVGGCQPCGTLFIYHADDGQKLGETHAAEDATKVLLAPDGSRIYVLRPNRIEAIDSATKSVAWAVSVTGTSDMAVHPDGDTVFVTAALPEALGNGNGDYGTFAYNSETGAKLWDVRYDGAPTDTVDDQDGSAFRGDTTDRPTALAVSPDGSRVYVVGTSRRSATVPGTDESTSTDAVEGSQATVAYAVATGEQVWSARYRQLLHGAEGNSGAANSKVPLVEVGPDGTVFTAGNVISDFTVGDVGATTSLRGNRQDWAVQAYAP